MPPLNLVGDFGGGSMLLVVGVLAALWEAQRSGRGQVVDAAMVDGASLLAQMVWGLRGQGCGPTSAGPTCSTGTPRSTTPTPAPTAGTWRSARSSRSSTRRCWPGSASTRPTLPAPVRPRRLARLRARFAEVVRHPHPRRVGRGVRRHRRLRHPGAHVRRGRRAPAPGRPRARSSSPDGVPQAAPGPAVLPHRRRRPGPAAPEPEDVDGVLADWSPAGRSRQHERHRRADGFGRRCRCAGRSASGARCRRPAGCGCGSGRPGCPGPWSWRR